MSLKIKIYLCCFLFVVLFLANGIAFINALNNSRKVSEYVSKVADPSLQSLQDFENLIIASRIHAADLVFTVPDQNDKDALKKAYEINYPELKIKLKVLSVQWNNEQMAGNLNKIYKEFEEFSVTQKRIIALSQKAEDYHIPAIKKETEMLVKNELIPRSSSLLKALSGLVAFNSDIKNQKNKLLNQSYKDLKNFILVFTILIIITVIFISLFIARMVLKPVTKLKNIVKDLARGIIGEVNNKITKDEIGEMAVSIISLSKKMKDITAFAKEIGNRNFFCDFHLHGPDDALGLALLEMRDSIKLNDEKLNDAQHIAHIGSWERNIKTDELILSDEMFNIFDISPQSFDFRFQTLMGFIHPDHKEFAMDISRKNLYMDPTPYECQIITPKGIIKNICVETKVVLGRNGEVEKTFGIVEDITERKLAEEKLAEERELFRLVIENIPDQIYLKDIDSCFLLCNLPVAANAGCTSQEDMIGKTDFDFLPKEIAKQCFIDEQNIIESGIPFINHEEYMLDKITGKPRWSLSSKFPLRNKINEIIGLIGINHDITDRKISEKKLEDVNKELSILFNSIDEIFFSANIVTLKVIQISASCEKIYGYTPSEFLANYKLWWQIIHPDDKHIIKKEDEIIRRGEPASNQYRIIRKDKAVRWVETKITPTLDEHGNLIRVDGVTRDITERKNAEEELIQKEKYNRNLFNQSTGGLALSKIDGTLIDINEAYASIIGRTIEDCKTLLFYQITPEKYSSKELEQLIDLELTGRYGPYEKEYIHKNGHLVPVRLSGTILEKDGIKYIWSSVEDITDIKLAEEAKHRSEENLERKNIELERKNIELEQFAYVASHDLQEPLRTTSSFVELLQQQYRGKLDVKADKYLTYISQASDRMAVLIKDLHDYSLIGSKKDIQQLDCNELLADVLADVYKTIKDSSSEIQADSLPVISGYPTEMKQLFQNLIVNAIKFRKEDVAPQIHISAEKKTNCWEFAFTDNGIGIDPQYNEKIFVIFQRLHTRLQYQGSGIGLSNCKKIVELHNGKIWVKSAPLKGSTFYFTIQSN